MAFSKQNVHKINQKCAKLCNPCQGHFQTKISLFVNGFAKAALRARASPNASKAFGVFS
jgi:hypothetical protein